MLFYKLLVQIKNISNLIYQKIGIDQTIDFENSDAELQCMASYFFKTEM